MIKLHQLLGLATLTATLGSTLVFANPAKADLHVCNKSSHKAYIAVGYGEGKDVWRSEGWYEIAPGNCSSVYQGDVSGSFFYLYGASGDERTAIWSGDRSFCVHPTNKFDYRSKADGCGRGGSEMRSFWEVKTDGAVDYTENINN